LGAAEIAVAGVRVPRALVLVDTHGLREPPRRGVPPFRHMTRIAGSRRRGQADERGYRRGDESDMLDRNLQAEGKDREPVPSQPPSRRGRNQRDQTMWLTSETHRCEKTP